MKDFVAALGQKNALLPKQFMHTNDKPKSDMTNVHQFRL